MKISIIGCGKVGSSIAYTLLLKACVDELILIDLDTKKRDGEIMDLIHTLSSLEYHPTILKGNIDDAKGSKLIIITAGLPRREGESRLDLLRNNANILKGIVSSINPLNPSTFLFIISNPVDLLTYLAAKYSNLPIENVFGLGTVLDTMRFKAHIGEYLGFMSNDIDALILGEHGDSMVPIWSLVRIGGIPLDKINLSNEAKKKILEATRQDGAFLNESKGGTNWGVSIAAYEVIRALSSPKKRILPVSGMVKDYQGIDGVSLSLPTYISVEGIGGRVHLPFSEEEFKGLMHSAQLLKEAISELRE